MKTPDMGMADPLKKTEQKNVDEHGFEAIESQEPSEYVMARQILSENFLSPREVQVPIEMDEDYLLKTFPTEEELLEVKEKRCCLIPGPPKEMTLKELCQIKSDLFLAGEFDETTKPFLKLQNFYTKEVVKPGWIVVQKELRPFSGISKEEVYVPNFVEIFWVIAAYDCDKENKFIFPAMTDVEKGRPIIHLGTSSTNLDHTQEMGLSIIYPQFAPERKLSDGTVLSKESYSPEHLVVFGFNPISKRDAQDLFATCFPNRKNQGTIYQRFIDEFNERTSGPEVDYI